MAGRVHRSGAPSLPPRQLLPGRSSPFVDLVHTSRSFPCRAESLGGSPPCRVSCCSEPCMLKCLDTLWRDAHCFCTRDPSLGCALPSWNVLRDRRRADSLDKGRHTACPSAITSHPQPSIRVTRYIFAKSSSSFTLTTHAVPNHTFFSFSVRTWPVGVVAIRWKVLSHMYSLYEQLVSLFCVCNRKRPGYFALLPEVTPTCPWFAVFVSHNSEAAYNFIKFFHFCCLPVACRHVPTQFAHRAPSQLCAKV